MFHWICPECGQEIAPGVKECADCEPQATAAPASPLTQPAAVAERPLAELPEPPGVPQLDVLLRPAVVLKPQAYTPSKAPAVLNEAQHEIHYQYLSAAKARRELAWAPLYPLEEGLRRTVAWYRSERVAGRR